MNRTQLPVLGDAGEVVVGLRAALQARVTGEVRFDRLSRALYSTDASIYQIVPVGVVLPKTEADLAAERERREDREEAEALATGRADWEVRIELPGREETDELGDRLEAEGIPVVRRAAFLLVGAASEHDAKVLAERLRAEAPAGSTVHVQPGGAMVWEVTPQNPFAILGGLGG